VAGNRATSSDVIDEERDAHLDSVLIGGREPVTVVVQDPDPGWPVRFSAVRDLLEASLGGRALAIEHVGSTAVPGLAAKPIIDVLLTVADVEDEGAYAPALESAGLVLRVREPGHRMFRFPEKDVHVHVHRPDDPAVTDLLDLRTDSGGRARTEPCTPRRSGRWPGREWPDMDHYADAKSAVIAEILSRARTEVRRRP
jgi:GrpB-like predicted nucleotidyltransferase (UPF0157 family)